MLQKFNDGHVTLEESEHRYFNRLGQEYDSVSSVLRRVEEPFDAKKISMNMTGSAAEAEKLQAEWKQINETSITWGNTLHKEAENVTKYGSVSDSSFKKLEEELYNKLIKNYKKNFSEVVVYDADRLISGTGDHFGFRKATSRNQIVDVNDFKTNLSKGIMNFTGKINEDRTVEKYYNNFLLHPLEYLEASNYVKYSLQLSMYGVMLEKCGLTVGALNIVYIDRNLDVSIIFVPYMRSDAIRLMDHFTGLKDIHGNPSSQYGKLKLRLNGIEKLANEIPFVDDDDNEWL